MPDLLRLLFAILLLLCSLLVFFRAPMYLLWKLAVAVTEFPHIFIFLTLISFFTRFSSHEYILTGDILLLSALIIFCYPVIAAFNVAAALKLKFTNEAHGFSFSFLKLIAGHRNKKISFEQLTYKKIPGKELTLDFYSSSSSATSACLVAVHGGSWSSGDSKQLAQLNSYLAAKGYHVAAINYRLAPKYNCPAPVEDVMDAINFLKENYKKMNIDTHNFILLGRSAGGQIALLTAYSELLPEVRGVISFYAPADMVWGWSLPGNRLVLDSRKVMKDYIGDTCEQAPEKFAASSPIEYVSEKSPPTLLIHGKNECMVAYEHSVRLSARLKKNNILHYFVTLPWGTHGCDYNLSGPTGQNSTFAIECFLKQIISTEVFAAATSLSLTEEGKEMKPN